MKGQITWFYLFHFYHQFCSPFHGFLFVSAKYMLHYIKCWKMASSLWAVCVIGLMYCCGYINIRTWCSLCNSTLENWQRHRCFSICFYGCSRLKLEWQQNLFKHGCYKKMCCILLLNAFKQHVYNSLKLYITKWFCPRLVSAPVYSLNPLKYCFTWLIIRINANI